MIFSRCAASLLILCLLVQPAYALPLTIVDPTNRTFTYLPTASILGLTSVAQAGDSNGNLAEEKKVATDESTRYAYDLLNRLTGVSSLRGGEAPAAISLATHTYDGEGKRISATEGGVTTTYLYDGLLPVLERQGSSTTVNVWGLSLGGGIGGLLCRHEPGASDSNRRFLYPLYDGSGNILAWTDSTGAVVGTVTYTAFGEVVSSSLRGGAEAISFGFSTKSFSPTTGLSYFGARYYRPDLGRWLTPDPLGQLDGPNVYSYVGNNPLNWLDPWGLSLLPIDSISQPSNIPLQLLLPNEPMYQAPGRSSNAPLPPGWTPEWKPGSMPGDWVDPEGRYWHWHGHGPHGPDWDVGDAEGNQWRVYPDGRIERKPGTKKKTPWS